MTKVILSLFLAINLLGCSTVPEGNFTKAPAEVNTIMTKDAVKQLVSLYPPAHTRFSIKAVKHEPFAVALIQLLRQQGYSINEASTRGSNLPETKEVVLSYLVDRPVKSTFYRVILTVGNTSISRAYREKNGTVTPLGYWVRRE